MPKSLIRIVALLLIPCCITDPALGRSLTNGFKPEFSVGKTSDLFTQQAVVQALGTARKDIEKIPHATVRFCQAIAHRALQTPENRRTASVALYIHGFAFTSASGLLFDQLPYAGLLLLIAGGLGLLAGGLILPSEKPASPRDGSPEESAPATPAPIQGTWQKRYWNGGKHFSDDGSGPIGDFSEEIEADTLMAVALDPLLRSHLNPEEARFATGPYHPNRLAAPASTPAGAAPAPNLQVAGTAPDDVAVLSSKLRRNTALRILNQAQGPKNQSQLWKALMQRRRLKLPLQLIQNDYVFDLRIRLHPTLQGNRRAVLLSLLNQLPKPIRPVNLHLLLITQPGYEAETLTAVRDDLVLDPSLSGHPRLAPDTDPISRRRTALFNLLEAQSAPVTPLQLWRLFRQIPEFSELRPKGVRNDIAWDLRLRLHPRLVGERKTYGQNKPAQPAEMGNNAVPKPDHRFPIDPDTLMTPFLGLPNLLGVLGYLASGLWIGLNSLVGRMRRDRDSRYFKPLARAA